MDDGPWLLIIQSVNLAAPWEIGRAMGPGPDGPWTVEPEPILSRGPAGSLDAGGLNWPSVVRTEEGYAMYHTAKAATTDRGGVIAVATSKDGLIWTKVDEPILEPEEEWEGAFIDRPRVARVGDHYAMVYSGTPITNRGLTWSGDGMTWEKAGSKPAITAEDFPITGGSCDAALVADGDELTYYLEIGNGSTMTEIFRAVAQVP